MCFNETCRPRKRKYRNELNCLQLWYIIFSLLLEFSVGFTVKIGASINYTFNQIVIWHYFVVEFPGSFYLCSLINWYLVLVFVQFSKPFIIVLFIHAFTSSIRHIYEQLVLFIRKRRCTFCAPLLKCFRITKLSFLETLYLYCLYYIGKKQQNWRLTIN